MPDLKTIDSGESRVAQKNHEPGPKPFWAFFCRQDVQLLIFALFFTALSWPFLTIANRIPPFYLPLAYLFGVWLVMIMVLFVIGRSIRMRRPSQASGDLEEGR